MALSHTAAREGGLIDPHRPRAHARSWILGSAAVVALSAASASAQVSAPQEVETVIVTAQKRAEDVQDVPISINVIQKQELEDFNRSDIKSIQGSIPGLFVMTSVTNNGVYLRGFGSAPANPAVDQSVSIFQDGVYLGRARQAMAPFFDVERVEVLRGPQGALVGKNTAAGALSITTAGPTETAEGSATVSYNLSREGPEAFGYVSGPIGPNLTARLALKYVDIGGYLHNTALDRDEPAVRSALGRLTVRYAPSDAFDVTTKLEIGDTEVTGNHMNNVPRLVRTAPSTTKNAGRPFGEEEQDEQDGYLSTTTVNVAIGEMTLTSITAFSGFDSGTLSGAAALNPARFYIAWYEKFDQQSQEIRLLSPSGKRFEWAIGAYYDKSQNGIYQQRRYNLFGGLFNGLGDLDFHQDTRSWSAFAQGTWRVSDRVRLLGSARYTSIHKEGLLDVNLVSGNLLTGTVPGRRGPRSFTDKLFDPAVTAQFDLSPNVMVYAAYAQGSKGGGFDGANTAVTNASFRFRPETSENIEIGEKGSFFSNRLVVNVSAFRLRFKDLQIASFVPGLGLVTANAASATSKGAEATATWVASDRLRFSAAGAYLDAKFDDFPGALCRSDQPLTVCNAAAPVTAPNSQANNNNKGFTLPNAPRWSGEIRADYEQPLSGDLLFRTVLVARYRSGVWIDNSYNPIYARQKAVTKLDARVQIGAEDGKWTLALVGSNLTNEITSGQSVAWPLETRADGTPVANTSLDEGRSVSIQAQLRF